MEGGDWACKDRPLVGGVWGMHPQVNFWILGPLRLILMPTANVKANNFQILAKNHGGDRTSVIRRFYRNRGDFLWTFYSTVEGAMKLKFCAILFLLRCPFIWYHFLPRSNFPYFGQKPWTIVRRFYRNRGDFQRSFYSIVEGAMKPKFASFWSS